MTIDSLSGLRGCLAIFRIMKSACPHNSSTLSQSQITATILPDSLPAALTADNTDNAPLDSGLSILKSVFFATHKLQKYCYPLEQSAVYWAAVLLHPGCTMQWAKELHPQKAMAAGDALEALFDGQAASQATEEPVVRLLSASMERAPRLSAED